MPLKDPQKLMTIQINLTDSQIKALELENAKSNAGQDVPPLEEFILSYFQSKAEELVKEHVGSSDELVVDKLKEKLSELTLAEKEAALTIIENLALK